MGCMILKTGEHGMAGKKIWMQFILVTAIVMTVCMTTYAQLNGGFRGGPGGFGGGLFGFGGGGSVSFAAREDVRNELDLSPRQIEEMEEISQSVQDEQRSFMRELMRERMADLRNMSDNERREAMQDFQNEIAKRNKKIRDKVVDVLSSRQKTRFNELEFQYNLQRGNAMAALTVADVELDEDDEDALREAMEKGQNKLREELARITREMQIEALATVMSESKVQRLMGDIFRFESRGGPGDWTSAGGPGRRPRGGDDNDGNVGRRRRPAGDDDDEQSSPRRRNRRREA